MCGWFGERVTRTGGFVGFLGLLVWRMEQGVEDTIFGRLSRSTALGLFGVSAALLCTDRSWVDENLQSQNIKVTLMAAQLP
jgi:hypothetical protein